MNRKKYQEMMRGAGQLDYEIYLNTEQLLACQKMPDAFCNPDELQFMIVHQVEELWMKLMASTLLDIDEEMQARHSFKALTLFRRVHICQEMMTTQLTLLETMSPKDYQEIRLLLGNGSGQESPGFRVLLKCRRTSGRPLRRFIWRVGNAHSRKFMIPTIATMKPI